MFAFDETLINIIDIAGAPELIEPASVAGPNAGARSMFTIRVDDVDALYAQLVDKGVTFLNGPVDRPWGPRTATFAVPAGHMDVVRELIDGKQHLVFTGEPPE